ncbi:MAG: hypothetical protein PHC97_00515 [Patescibacteria group bacterium]|nr:hypothetical protein [Patescibacteria group bacterium]
MKKTITIIIIFLIIAAGVALSFSYFFNPQKVVTQRFSECVLLQDTKNGTVGCFGCANEICKDAPEGWVLYKKPQVGIPYACNPTPDGCVLVQ